MTTLREAAQQALEACTDVVSGWESLAPLAVRRAAVESLDALRAALAEPTVKESLQVEPAIAETATTEQEVEQTPPSEYRRGYWAGFEIGKREGRIEAEDALAEPVQEPVECEPQYANKDGWCDWVCPIPQGYLMQCCDCGLIHEVESRVVKYEPLPSEAFVVVGDPDFQVQWRMKRRDDISPKQQKQEPVAWTDADADAARLAMELEALLLSCKDTAAVSRWWDSAHDALDLHRQRLSMDGLANQQKTSGSPCPTCEALARAVMMDQTGKA